MANCINSHFRPFLSQLWNIFKSVSVTLLEMNYAFHHFRAKANVCFCGTFGQSGVIMPFWQPASTVTPVSPTSWYTRLCLIPPHVVAELICVTKRTWQKMVVSLLTLGHKLPSFCFSCSHTLSVSEHLLWVKPCPEKPYGEVYRGGTEASNQQPRKWAWKPVFQPQPSLQRLQPPQRPEPDPAKPLPGSWPSEAVR